MAMDAANVGQKIASAIQNTTQGQNAQVGGPEHIARWTEIAQVMLDEMIKQLTVDPLPVQVSTTTGAGATIAATGKIR